MLVEPQRAPSLSAGTQGAKDSLGASVNLAVRFDELNRLFERLDWDFWKPPGDLGILRGRVVYSVSGQRSPACDPIAAETTVPVEDQQRFVRWRYDSRGNLREWSTVTMSYSIPLDHPSPSGHRASRLLR